MLQCANSVASKTVYQSRFSTAGRHYKAALGFCALVHLGGAVACTEVPGARMGTGRGRRVSRAAEACHAFRASSHECEMSLAILVSVALT